MKLLLTQKDIETIIATAVKKEFPGIFPGEVEIDGISIYSDVKIYPRKEDTDGTL